MEIKILLWVLVAVNLFLGTFTLSINQSRPKSQKIHRWYVANYLLAAGYILYLNRTHLPNISSILAANALLTLAIVLRIYGFAKLYEEKVSKGQNAILTLLIVLFIAAIAFFTISYDDIKVRSIIISLALAAFSIYFAVLLWINRKKYSPQISIFTAAAFIIFAGFNMARSIYFWASPESISLFNASLLNISVFVGLLLIDINWAIIILFIYQQKLLIEQEQAASKLKKFSTAVEQSPAAIVITDTEGRIEYVNPKFTEITGYTSDEALGENPKILKTDSHRKEYYRKMWDTISSGEVWNGEFYNKHKNGTCFWEEAVIAPIFDKRSRITSYVALKHNITERKKMQAKLLRSKAKLKEAQEVGKVGHWDYDIKKDKLYWSEQVYKIFEVSPETFEPVYDNVIKFYHPDDLERIEAEYEQAVANKKNLEISFRIISKTGKTKHIIQRVRTKYSRSGEAVSSLGSIQDITKLKNTEEELKKNEALFRAIFDTSPAGISIFSEDGKDIFVNKAFEKIHGYSQTEEIGKDFLQAIHPADRSMAEEKVRDAFRGKLKSFAGEIRYLHKNGKTVWAGIVATVFPMKIDDKKAILTVNQDITKQKETEAELEMINASKDKFFSIISHDLRNPFNSILGLSKLLMRDIELFEKEDIIKYSTLVHKSSQNAYKLLENLLQWASAQTGSIPFKPSRFSLNKLIDEVMEIYENAAQLKKIIIKKQDDSEITVYADFNMIHTVLRNLIGNAIKFTHKQGLITVNTEVSSDEVIVSVKDNGIGIKEEKLKDLFNIEVKTVQLGTNQEKGTGLGLLLCKEFIDKHGGKIWAESPKEQGSCFYFSLPIS